MRTNKLIIALAISLIANFSMAQVGVGTLVPNGALDVTSATDGLLIPRIALSATNTATVITPTTSEIVYNTFTSAVGANQVTPGFYYWNGTLWVRLATGNNNDWSLTGNASTVPGTNFLGTTDAQALVIKTNNTEKVRVNSNGNVGIGQNNPVNGQLEVNGKVIIGNTYTGGLALGQTGGLTVEGRTIIGEDNFYYTVDKAVVYGNTLWSPGNVTTGDNGNGLIYAINGYTSDGVGLYAEDNDGGTGVEVNVSGTNTNRAIGLIGYDLSGRGYGVVGISNNNLATRGYVGVQGIESSGTTGHAVLSSGDLGYTGALLNLSDVRLKKNIKPLNNALELIEKINPKTYDMKWEDYKTMGLSREPQMGFIAQELETVLPSLVSDKKVPLNDNIYTKKELEKNPELAKKQGSDMDVKMVNYVQMVPLLTQAIKEQQEIIKALEARIEKLEKK